MDSAELLEVERLMNEEILKNIPVETNIMALEQAIATGAERIEATPEAGEAWTQMCDMILGMTLVPKGIEDRPWFLGANVPGKKPTTLCYLGGMAGYCAELDKEIGGGFPGYEMSKAPVPA
jgi:cyclohexanone monooxygenase